MSAAYQRRAISRRKFPESKERDEQCQLIMSDTYTSLSKQWMSARKSENPPKELEMDFVAHTSTCKPSAKCQFGSRIHVVEPSSSSSSSSLSSPTICALNRDISPEKSQAACGHALEDEEDAECRFYVVFEITRGESKNMIDAKLLQLERDLTFLWLRQCTKSNLKPADLPLLGIVAFAGIATPLDNASSVIAQKLEKNPERWPLLMQLVADRRLLAFVEQPSLFETISISTNASPTSPAIAAEVLKREKLRTRKEEMSVKKEEMSVKKEEMAMMRVQIETAKELGQVDLVEQLSELLLGMLRPDPPVVSSTNRLNNNRGRRHGRGRGKGKSQPEQH